MAQTAFFKTILKFCTTNKIFVFVFLEQMQNFKSVTPIDIQLNEAARGMRRQEKRHKNNHQIMFDVIRHLAKQSNLATDDICDKKHAVKYFSI